MEWQDQQAKNSLDRPIYWFNSNEMIFQLLQNFGVLFKESSIQIEDEGMYLDSNSQSKDLGIEFRCRLSFTWSWGALAQEANRSLESSFQGTACLSPWP